MKKDKLLWVHFFCQHGISNVHFKDEFFNELHFQDKSQAPTFNFRSPNHAGRVKKYISITQSQTLYKSCNDSPTRKSGPEKRVRFEGRLPVTKQQFINYNEIIGQFVKAYFPKFLWSRFQELASIYILINQNIKSLRKTR